MTTMAKMVRTGFVALVLLLVLVGGVRLAIGQYTVQAVDRVTGAMAAARQDNVAILQGLTDAETGIRGYQLTSVALFLQPYYDGVAHYRDASRELADFQGESRLDTLVLAQQRAAEAWLRFAQPIALPTSDSPANSVGLSQDGKVLFDAFRRANAAVQADLDRSRSAAISRFKLLSTIGEVIVALLSLVSALLAVGLARRTIKQFLEPLENMRHTLVRLAGGEQAARAPESGPPEVRQVSRALNALTDETERLQRSVQSRAAIVARAHELGAKVRGSLDTDAVLNEVVTGVAESLGVGRVYIRLAVQGRSGRIERQWQRPGLPPLSGELLRTGDPDYEWPVMGLFVCDDVTDPDQQDRTFRPDDLAATGARAYLAGAFTIDADRQGVLVAIDVDGPRHWTEEERGLLEAVATDAGRGLHLAAVFGHQRELAERFQDLDRQKTDFISTVSHELRTPLTSILGYLEVLLSGDQGELDESQIRSLQVIERNAERLRELVGDLLTLSRIGSGSLEMTSESLDIADLVEAVETVFVPAAAGAGLVLECSAEPGLMVFGDARQLERVLLNLVGNGIKFTTAGGKVRLTAVAEGADGVRVAVTDTGIGIPDSDVERLFQPFQRASNAVASAIQGTGLGLAIARSIVERHAGEITLTSTVGEGTSISFVLPRAQPGAIASVSPALAGAGAQTAATIQAAKARALSRAAAQPE